MPNKTQREPNDMAKTFLKDALKIKHWSNTYPQLAPPLNNEEMAKHLAFLDPELGEVNAESAVAHVQTFCSPFEKLEEPTNIDPAIEAKRLQARKEEYEGRQAKVDTFWQKRIEEEKKAKDAEAAAKKEAT